MNECIDSTMGHIHVCLLCSLLVTIRGLVGSYKSQVICFTFDPCMKTMMDRYQSLKTLKTLKVVKSLITSGERRWEFRGGTILEVFLRQILEDLQNGSNTCYSCSVTQNCLTHYSCSETQKCRVISLLLFVHRRSLNTDNIRHTPTPSFMRIIP